MIHFHVHVVSIIRKHNIVCHYNVHAVIIMLKEFAQTQFNGTNCNVVMTTKIRIIIYNCNAAQYHY